ncbi:MAG: flagellar hook-basal body complex protein FliE [Oscillospiraceae bacterium]
MFLQPITNLQPLSTQNTIKNTSTDNKIIPFADIFTNAVDNLKDTQQNLDQEVIKVATGEVDDLHSVQIASEKVSLALNMVIEIRNKSLEAYNELMRINI